MKPFIERLHFQTPSFSKGQPLDKTYFNQDPAVNEVTTASNTSVTKKFSLMMPKSNAKVASTMHGPPRSFNTTARLKLDNQSYLRNLVVMRTAIVWTITAKTINTLKNHQS